jgi:hypothetical protein
MSEDFDRKIYHDLLSLLTETLDNQISETEVIIDGLPDKQKKLFRFSKAGAESGLKYDSLSGFYTVRSALREMVRKEYGQE